MNGLRRAVVAVVLVMTALDLSALRGIRLPSADAIRAELERRKPLWTPQHRKDCQHYRGKGIPVPLTRDEWAAKPCRCPQVQAFFSLADLTGYGGAAGGGKSDLITGLGVTQHKKSIIFRREREESRDLFDRACEIVGDAGEINRTVKLIRLPGGRQLEYGGVKNASDWVKHRGRARDGYFFDEGTEFEEMTVRQLIGWNRTTVPGQRCRVVITFNPPSLKRGQWLKKMFAPWIDPKYRGVPAEDGELRWFTTVKGQDIEVESGAPVELANDGTVSAHCEPLATVEDAERVVRCASCGAEILIPLSRTFIRATLSDNEFLADTNYRATLQGLPEPLRSQLLYGDMQAEESDDAYQVIPTKWVQLAQDRWLKRAKPLEPLQALGSDPAHGGDDDNVAAPRIGTWFDFPTAVPGKQTPHGRDTLKLLAKVAGDYRCYGKIIVGMDVIGVGASPADLADELDIQLLPLNGSEAADEMARDRTGVLRFANKRAQWYWSLREALDPERGQDLALPPDHDLLVDLTAPCYDLTPRGIKIEDKADVKKRIGRSPGKGDAVVYAYATHGFDPGYESIEAREGISDYDYTISNEWKTTRGY